jgi:hypothetical protein
VLDADHRRWVVDGAKEASRTASSGRPLGYGRGREFVRDRR